MWAERIMKGASHRSLMLYSKKRAVFATLIAAIICSSAAGLYLSNNADPAEFKSCKRLHGTWTWPRKGKKTNGYCIREAEDAGKPCTDNDQCTTDTCVYEGKKTVAGNRSVYSGTCYKFTGPKMGGVPASISHGQVIQGLIIDYSPVEMLSE